MTSGETAKVGIWSRNKSCMRLEWALVNSFVGGERARKGLLEEMISELGFAVWIGVRQEKKVGENILVRKKENKGLLNQELSSEASGLKVFSGGRWRETGEGPNPESWADDGSGLFLSDGGHPRVWIRGRTTLLVLWRMQGWKQKTLMGRLQWIENKVRQGQCERRKMIDGIDFF